MPYLSAPMWIVPTCWGPGSTRCVSLAQQSNWGNLSTAKLIFVVPYSRMKHKHIMLVGSISRSHVKSLSMHKFNLKVLGSTLLGFTSNFLSHPLAFFSIGTNLIQEGENSRTYKNVTFKAEEQRTDHIQITKYSLQPNRVVKNNDIFPSNYPPSMNNISRHKCT